ncbi:MAG TPA: hypothetical protein VEX88_07780 [Glaciibacter sp.]|nr:hypothetical protein [Glaciibacter sp.]
MATNVVSLNRYRTHLASPTPGCHTSRMRTRGLLYAATIAVTVVALTGCATADQPGGPPPASDDVLPIPVTSDQLLGQGTVLQRGEEAAMFCLGGVAESYPPSCTGPGLLGWDWASVEQHETASDTTWGTYAVQGTWDGIAFTKTGDAIPLSLYDPMADFDPRADEKNRGSTDEPKLQRVLDDMLAAYDMPPVLSYWTENGYAWIGVIYDDGQVQAYLDEKYGPGVVAVASALRPVS